MSRNDRGEGAIRDGLPQCDAAVVLGAGARTEDRRYTKKPAAESRGLDANPFDSRPAAAPDQNERRTLTLRPLLRLRLTSLRPLLVFIRARKPNLRARLMRLRRLG